MRDETDGELDLTDGHEGEGGGSASGRSMEKAEGSLDRGYNDDAAWGGWSIHGSRWWRSGLGYLKMKMAGTWRKPDRRRGGQGRQISRQWVGSGSWKVDDAWDRRRRRVVVAAMSRKGRWRSMGPMLRVAVMGMTGAGVEQEGLIDERHRTAEVGELARWREHGSKSSEADLGMTEGEGGVAGSGEAGAWAGGSISEREGAGVRPIGRWRERGWFCLLAMGMHGGR